jgi:hypothetical protein
MAGKAAIDWDYWKYKYVSGSDEVTLEALSNIPNAPKLPTLKKRSVEDSWADQRKAFRYQTYTKISDSATTQQAVEQTQKLVDAADVITRHLQMAKALQSIAAKRLTQFDPEELSARDLVAWVNAATNIERLAMGLSTEQHEVNVKVNFGSLSDEQLERLAKGENPAHVLN